VRCIPASSATDELCAGAAGLDSPESDAAPEDLTLLIFLEASIRGGNLLSSWTSSLEKFAPLLYSGYPYYLLLI
jgi:hypothetical protein